MTFFLTAIAAFTGSEIYLWVNRGVHLAFLQIKDNLPVCRFFNLLCLCWKVSNEKKLPLCNWNFIWTKRVNMVAVPAHVSECPVKHHCSCLPAQRLEIRYINRNTLLMEKSPSVGSDKWVQPSYLLLGRVSEVAYLMEHLCRGSEAKYTNLHRILVTIRQTALHVVWCKRVANQCF